MPENITTQNTPKNIDLWRSCLDSLTPAYASFFSAEEKYLKENIHPKDNILDIGSGTGRIVDYILQSTPHVTGIDYDQETIEGLRKKYKNQPLTKFVNANAADLPFEDECFDVITFSTVFCNIEDKSKAMSESARVLKKEGFLFLSTYSEDALDDRVKQYKKAKLLQLSTNNGKITFVGGHTSAQFTLEELEQYGLNAGLELVDYKKCGKLAYICKFQKV